MSQQNLYRDPIRGEVYVELFNELHVIANIQTLKAIFGDNPNVIDEVPPYGKGFPIGGGSFLLRTPAGVIYLVTNQQKHLIANPATINYYQFNGDVYGSDFLAKLVAPFIPDGPEITI